jgi:hypothetical protein
LAVTSGERRAVADAAEPSLESEFLSEFPSESEPVRALAPVPASVPAPRSTHLHPRNLLVVIGLVVLAGGAWELLDVARQSWSGPESFSDASTTLVATPAPIDVTGRNTTTPPMAPYVRAVNRSAVFDLGTPNVLSPSGKLEAPAPVLQRASVARSPEPLPERRAVPLEATLLAPVAESTVAATRPALGAGEPAAAVRTAAEPVITAAATIEIETEAVRETLARYEAALEDLDVTTTAEVWPSVDRSMLARAFSTLKSQGITLGACVFAVADGEASARCRGSMWFVPKIGRSEPRESAQDWVFKLKKLGDEWKIADVTATVSQSSNPSPQHR